MKREEFIETLMNMVCAAPNDAVLLAVSDREDWTATVEKLNLQGLTEIKRSDKGVELKFIDRVKLAELILQAQGQSESNAADTLLEAMNRGD